jgi:hypothetical protein
MRCDRWHYDREQRQYTLMRQSIDAFRSGQLSIGQVNADLEGLANAL